MGTQTVNGAVISELHSKLAEAQFALELIKNTVNSTGLTDHEKVESVADTIWKCGF